MQWDEEMDGCLVYGLKHDAKQGKLDRFLVCLDINHGFMYIKGKEETKEKYQMAFIVVLMKNPVHSQRIIR